MDNMYNMSHKHQLLNFIIVRHATAEEKAELLSAMSKGPSNVVEVLLHKLLYYLQAMCVFLYIRWVKHFLTKHHHVLLSQRYKS